MSATPTQINGHTPSSDTPAVQGQTSKIQPGDVGWQFVPQYYNFVNKQPHRLHCFYNKRSTFLHGEEGEEAQVALGQQEIHDRITAIGYDQCKVYIHSIDSQSSANGGIIILVIGEICNNNQSWRKFSQTFFLAEQPNGYFVLNDIFRYLKEEVDDDEDEEIPDEVPVEIPVTAPVPIPIDESNVVSQTAPAEKEIEQEPESAPEPAPEPEPVQSPAHPNPEVVPEEALIANIPDHDVSPTDPPAVEEPTTATDPQIEESAPTPMAPIASPVPTPVPTIVNGTSAPSQDVAAPAPSKPSAPKSWASMAAAGASNAKPAWGTAIPASQPAAPAPAPAPPVVAKKEDAPPAASSSTPQQRHPYYENAMKVQTPHCFVKLPNWSIDNQAGGESMDENTLRQIASRFGDVAKVEIVKSKACAFVEFAKVEAARRAIVASLSVPQGGEGGVKAGEGKINFETRKEKDERRPKAGNRGGAVERGSARGGARTGGPGRDGVREDMPPNGERANGPGGADRGRGRGRGRGGSGGGSGDRAPPQSATSK